MPGQIQNKTLSQKSPKKQNKRKSNLHILLLQEHVMEYSQELQKRPPPHTNHDEIILLVGLERLVEAECLRLDSAQHGPGREGESVGLGLEFGSRVQSPEPASLSPDPDPGPRSTEPHPRVRIPERRAATPREPP